MSFWAQVNRLALEDFRPGIRSIAALGDRLVMACMEIAGGKEDPGHEHSFDQCGIVTEGEIEMFIGDERRVLKAMDSYFIPAGVIHGWKTISGPVRILDVCSKVS
jgi:quercetin dioxygenase-like cupin family protein